MTTNRPRTWNDYVGQEAMKARLGTHVAAARKAKRPLDHILLVGPPGCGKTTVAKVIANGLGRNFHDFVCPVDFEILDVFFQAHRNCVLFLDEIHRYPANQQERLLSVLEDFYLQRRDGTRCWVDGITIIGATTEPDMVIAPLMRRFLIKPEFDEYSPGEMAAIVARMAKVEGVPLADVDIDILGGATGGLPGNAVDLIVAARDIYETQGHVPTADEVMTMVRVTAEGITERHRRYLAALEQMGGTAGIGLLATHMRLPHETVLDTERLLLKLGRIRYGRRGRELVAA